MGIFETLGMKNPGVSFVDHMQSKGFYGGTPQTAQGRIPGAATGQPGYSPSLPMSAAGNMVKGDMGGGLFTPKFFESDLYKFLQAPADARQVRETQQRLDAAKAAFPKGPTLPYASGPTAQSFPGFTGNNAAGGTPTTSKPMSATTTSKWNGTGYWPQWGTAQDNAQLSTPWMTNQTMFGGIGQPSAIAAAGSPYMTSEERALLERQAAASKALQNGGAGTMVAGRPGAPGGMPGAPAQNPMIEANVPFGDLPQTAYNNPRWGAGMPQGQPTPNWNPNDPMTQLANANAAEFMANPMNPRAAGDAPLMSYGNTDAGPMSGPREPPPLSRSQQYALTNAMSQLNAKTAQGNMTGNAGGWQYQNGQKVGYAPQTLNGVTYTPSNPGTAYGLANTAGQINALNKQATSTGAGTNGYQYVNGGKVGQADWAKGLSPTQQYVMANGPNTNTPDSSGRSRKKLEEERYVRAQKAAAAAAANSAPPAVRTPPAAPMNPGWRR